MLFFERTLGEPQANVSLDDELLLAAEQGTGPQQVLRLWEPPRPFVVLGRSSSPDAEVNLPVCQQLDLPIVRRSSGGATIVTGPGCLMYALVLPWTSSSGRPAIDQLHGQVLDRLVGALAPCLPGVARQGTSDLVWAGRKFSGNSLRICRRHFLYHGTLLYDFPLELITRCLHTPLRQPAYRDGRTHSEFLVNCSLSRAGLTSALAAAWNAVPATACTWANRPGTP